MTTEPIDPINEFVDVQADRTTFVTAEGVTVERIPTFVAWPREMGPMPASIRPFGYYYGRGPSGDPADDYDEQEL